jgi:hypothetical protein
VTLSQNHVIYRGLFPYILYFSNFAIVFKLLLCLSPLVCVKVTIARIHLFYAVLLFSIFTNNYLWSGNTAVNSQIEGSMLPNGQCKDKLWYLKIMRSIGKLKYCSMDYSVEVAMSETYRQLEQAMAARIRSLGLE